MVHIKHFILEGNVQNKFSVVLSFIKHKAIGCLDLLSCLLMM